MHQMKVFLCASLLALSAALAPAQQDTEQHLLPGKPDATNGKPDAEIVLPAETTSGGDIDLAALKQRFQNAVVKIEFTAVYNREETRLNPTKSATYYSGNEPPHGSGFFISESEILTNAHVVDQARRGSIRIKTPSTENVEYKVDVLGVGGSETIDLAVLRLPQDEVLRLKKRSGLTDIPVLHFADSDSVKQADPLAIFGYPQSSDELKIIQAKVTGRQYLKFKRGRFICGHQFIEVGPGGVIQPGNSGGPALNRDGKVVGIPARGLDNSEQGWIIPSHVVMQFLDRVKKSEAGRKSLELPMLGVSLTEDFPGTAVWSGAPEDCVFFELGVQVSEVTTNSLAEKWGLKNGDLLVGFANAQKKISCALDFQGYRVTTGKMRVWPPDGNDTLTTIPSEAAKLHLSEMILTSNPGDDITLWYVRRGLPGLQVIHKKFEYREPTPLPHIGPFDKPEFELWADFVAQDFNDYNTALFEVPIREIQAGGVLVSAVEPNSLASRIGMELNNRSTYGFSWSGQYEPATSWVIIESINEKPVNSLKELKQALRSAEKAYQEKIKAPGSDPSRRLLMKERYVEIGFRTNTYQGSVLHLKPAVPIDDALECRKNLNIRLD
jgi:S1-C subfamily serine protease